MNKSRKIPAPDHDESWADTGSHMMRAGSEQWYPVVTVAPGQEGRDPDGAVSVGFTAGKKGGDQPG
jgi:hypothetical protein